MTKHSPVCSAQNANPLFEGAFHYICDDTWRKAEAKAAKAAKPARQPNPCFGADLVEVDVPTEHWQVRLPFKPSAQQLLAYQRELNVGLPKSRQHRPVLAKNDKGESRPTFDDDAIRTLRQRHPTDPLYPRVEDFRILQKALTTYLAKLRPTLPDGRRNALIRAGRLHDAYRHTPSTLRLSMELLQVLPRPERGQLAPTDPRRIYDAIRRCFVPEAGHELIAADFSGIEPLLVAYFARDAHYLRACKLNGHNWFTAFVVGRPVDLTQSDADVTAHFAELAAIGSFTVRGVTMPWKQIRDGCKTTHMASLYAGGPGEIARANPDLFESAKDAAYYQDAFFDLAPSVRQWHWATAEEADRNGYLTSPIGQRLHFFNLFDHRFSKSQGKWVKSLSREAKAAVAAMPQHTGAIYLDTAAVTLAEERPDLAEWLRLLIHDEIFSEVPVELAEEFLAVLTEIMQRPLPLMPLWPEAAALVGESHLSVQVEAKRSTDSWGRMK